MRREGVFLELVDGTNFLSRFCLVSRVMTATWDERLYRPLSVHIETFYLVSQQICAIPNTYASQDISPIPKGGQILTVLHCKRLLSLQIKGINQKKNELLVVTLPERGLVDLNQLLSMKIWYYDQIGHTINNSGNYESTYFNTPLK